MDKQRFVIEISGTVTNVDLFAYARAQGYDGLQQCAVTVYVLDGAIVGSQSITEFAMTVQNFPEDCELTIVNNGYIVGRGGDSGGGGTSYCAPGPLGTDGGHALKVR